MKPKLIPYLLVVAGAAVFAFSPSHLTAQSDTESPATIALIQEVQKQEATMAENQKEIDAKLATMNETLKQARIFAARGGGR